MRVASVPQVFRWSACLVGLVGVFLSSSLAAPRTYPNWTTHFDSVGGMMGASHLSLMADGAIWFNSDTRLCRVDTNNALTAYNPVTDLGLPQQSQSSFFRMDLAGRLWMKNGTTLICYLDRSLQTRDTSIVKSYPSGIIDLLFQSPTITWALRTTGIARYDGTSWVTFDTGNTDLPSMTLRSPYIDNLGDFWICSRRSIARYRSGGWTVFDSTKGYPIPKNSSSITQDESGRYWMGTDTGLLRYDGAAWYHYDAGKLPSPQSRYDPFVTSTATDCTGGVWFTHLGTGFFRFKDGVWAGFGYRDSLIYPAANDGLQSLKIDKKNRVCLMSNHGGLYIYDNPEVGVHPYPQLIGFPGESVTTRKPKFTWHRVNQATQYTIRLGTNASFTTVTDSATTSDTSYTFSANLPYGEVYWQVKCDRSPHYSYHGVVTVKQATGSIPPSPSEDQRSARGAFTIEESSRVVRISGAQGQSTVDVEVFSLSGRKIYRASLQPRSDGKCYLPSPGSLSTSWPVGTYVVRASVLGKKLEKKVMFE